MKRGKLELKDINPIVNTYSYSKIESIFGDRAAEVAQLVGVKKLVRTKKKKQDEGGE